MNNKEDLKKNRNKKNRNKKNSKLKKHNKAQLTNKKRRNNKVLKAKEIIRKNKEALHHGSADISDETLRRKKIFRIIRKILFWIIIVLLAVALIAFVLIRVNDGTPTIFGYSIQRVSSGSMEPAYHVGDMFLSKSVNQPDEVQKGDIVTFKGDSSYQNKSVTHRVIRAPSKNKDGEFYIVTKGDANEIDDGEILFSDVESKSLTKLDAIKKMYDVFLSPWGLLIFIAVLIMIYFDELLTFAKVLAGVYNAEEDAEYREEIERERQVEEKRRLEEELRAHKRANWKKYDNTSKKKKKNRKNNKERAKGRFVK